MTEKLRHVVPYETGDGSMTLYDEERDIHYRSFHGAISESRHVFLGATGLLERRHEWRVAELGFGAAVNFTQTVKAFRADDGVSKLVYHSVDWRPVTAEHLEFHQGEGGDLARELVSRFHSAQDGQDRQVRLESEDGAIDVVLHASPWHEVDLAGVRAQAFFHDPFSKRVNPDGWTREAFAGAMAAMDESGRLATYSAATSVKRAMFEAGFVVATAPGPGRKREITVASPSAQALQGLELLEREKYLGAPQ